MRRLLPALYAMVALTALPAFHYLRSYERLEFFRSVAAVVTFTSNFSFWFQAGYFDDAAKYPASNQTGVHADVQRGAARPSGT